MQLQKLKLIELSVELVSLLDDKKGFFSSYNWYKNIISAVFNKDSLDHFFFIIKDNKILTVFPLIYYRDSNDCRCLKSLSNYYSPIYNVLGKGMSDDAISMIFDSLKNTPSTWDTLELDPLSESDSNRLALLLKKSSIPSIPYFCFVNWFHILNGQSFSEYFNSRPSHVKNTIKRKLKKFDEMPGSKIVVMLDSVNIEKGIHDYNQVYENSWKKNEPYPEFIPGLISYAAADGNLRLGLAYIDDIPVAAQIWFVADQSAYIFKLAYDDNYKKYSVGTLLTTRLMEHVIDVDKVDVIDYLSGNDSYKKDWMTQYRIRWGIKAFNTGTLQGYIKYLIAITKYHLKKGLYFARLLRAE